MGPASFASDELRTLEDPPDPSRCPYCPTVLRRHWSLAATYERYALRSRQGAIRVRVPRYRCHIAGRTFSLLHDSLLPYHSPTATQLLQWLHAMLIEGTPTHTLACRLSVPRKTLADLKRKFLQAAPVLRLPGSETAPDPVGLLRDLASQSGARIARLFRDWKETEPKHSIVGIYAR